MSGPIPSERVLPVFQPGIIAVRAAIAQTGFGRGRLGESARRDGRGTDSKGVGGMASVESPQGRSWHEIVRDTLKANEVRLITYVPDNVLKPLISAVHADAFFTA